MSDRTNILVLGASGMLGSAVRDILTQNGGWCVDGTQSEDSGAAGYMDILKTGEERWKAVIQRRRYQYIVNCIGILKPAVDEGDSSSLQRAIRVNSLFPHQLAEVATETRIIHLSTDGVFSGRLDAPYLETDPPDCRDAYGKSKALGESPASNVLNIRCSIVGRDSRGGKGLIEWVLRTSDTVLSGFDDHHWNGVTTLQFARLCRGIIESGSFDTVRLESGLHHFCPNPAITKFELLCYIQQASGRKITVRRGSSGTPVTRVLGTVYSSLRSLFLDSQSWKTTIQDALDWMPAD